MGEDEGAAPTASERGLLINANSRAISHLPLQTPPSSNNALQHPEERSNMAEDEPKSIRALFSTAERLRNNLNNFPDSNSPTFQENLTNAIATYESCLTLSEQVSLFSPNESLDDVSSSDIQYVDNLYFALFPPVSVPRIFRSCLTSHPDTCR